MNWLRHGKPDSGTDLAPGYVTAGSLGRSANGTPLDQILHAGVDLSGLLQWIPIPNGWDGYWTSPEIWAHDYAPDIWGLWHEQNPGTEKPNPQAIARTALELKSYAEKWGGFDPYRKFAIVTYLHVPSPTVSALPVKVFVDDTPDLTVEQAAKVDNPDAIESPVVEEFTTDVLGKGLKVTAHGLLDPEPDDLPGTRGLWVQVRYTFAVPDRQAVVTVAATHTDLGRMAAANADLDEFVRRISLHRAGEQSPIQP